MVIFTETPMAGPEFRVGGVSGDAIRFQNGTFEIESENIPRPRKCSRAEYPMPACTPRQAIRDEAGFEIHSKRALALNPGVRWQIERIENGTSPVILRRRQPPAAPP
jgi:hypothetical protein